MSKQKLAVQVLDKYLPQGAFDLIAPLFEQYAVQLIITKERKTILGNYRPPIPFKETHHRISINGNLNPYQFLVTLVHEFAHLVAFVHYKNRIAPHGIEWHQIYVQLLTPFIHQGLFPDDVTVQLKISLQKVRASSCSDPALFKLLSKYDKDAMNDKEVVFLSDLIVGDYFVMEDGRMFYIVEKKRTRYVCVECNSHKRYLIAAIAKVKRINWN